MAVWSDMNGFPEGGFPILANDNDMICLNTLYSNPLKAAQYIIDVSGNNRLAGALIIAGALSGVTSLGMNGALSGVTTIAANNTATLSHDTAPLVLSGQNAALLMTGLNTAIGSILQKIKTGFFKYLVLDNRPVVGQDEVALRGDIEQKFSNSVPDGTYSLGLGATTGQITINKGVITAIQEVSA